MSPTLDAFLRSWPFDPWLLAALGLAAGIYLRGWLALRRRNPQRWPAGPCGAFLGGLAAIGLALASPIEPFRFTDASQVEAAFGHRCHSGEDGVLPLPVEKVRWRRCIFRKTKMCGIFPYHHQLFGIFEGKRP